MAADGVSEALHSQWQADDEVADVGRLLALANARQHGDTNREQALPEFKPRQHFRCGHLDVMPNLFATVPLLLRDVTTGTDLREVGPRLLVEIFEDRVGEFLWGSLPRENVVGTAVKDDFRDGLRSPPSRQS